MKRLGRHAGRVSPNHGFHPSGASAGPPPDLTGGQLDFSLAGNSGLLALFLRKF